MKIKLSHIISLLIFLFALFIVGSDDFISFFESRIEGSFWGPFAYVGALVAGTVLAPITVLPLIPLSASAFGPFFAGVLSVIGWSVGGIIAFLIARYIGKPVIRHIISLEEIEKWESRLSSETEFWGLVVLRAITPVDILSYAVGLFSKISFRLYALATVIGVTPFSFILAYGGEALSEGSFLRLSLIVFLGVLLFWALYRFARKNLNI